MGQFWGHRHPDARSSPRHPSPAASAPISADPPSLAVPSLESSLSGGSVHGHSTCSWVRAFLSQLQVRCHVSYLYISSTPSRAVGAVFTQCCSFFRLSFCFQAKIFVFLPDFMLWILSSKVKNMKAMILGSTTNVHGISPSSHLNFAGRDMPSGQLFHPPGSC